MTHSPLGTLNAKEFLARHWQQKHLLVRNAFATPELSFDAAELAGLSCDTQAHSRLIQQTDEQHWDVKRGPFSDEDFTRLPATHWTLMVNDIQHYYPELLDYLEPFRFLPDWRIDDLMISYAVKHGSVGPHVDEYDVFLIQLAGTRRWSISNNTSDNTGFDRSLLPDQDLAILQNFSVSDEWLLEPGDMLYLPPGIPHYGVAADNDCITLSVGFRAPSAAELLQSWLDDRGDEAALKQRFSDAGRLPQPSPGLLARYDREAIRQHMLDVFNDPDSFNTWLGNYLTDGKTSDEVLLDSLLQTTSYAPDDSYQRAPGLRMAYTTDGDNLTFFAGGESFKLSTANQDAVVFLCKHVEYPREGLAQYCRQEEIKILINTLINNNNIVLMEPPECSSDTELLPP